MHGILHCVQYERTFFFFFFTKIKLKLTYNVFDEPILNFGHMCFSIIRTVASHYLLINLQVIQFTAAVWALSLFLSFFECYTKDFLSKEHAVLLQRTSYLLTLALQTSIDKLCAVLHLQQRRDGVEVLLKVLNNINYLTCTQVTIGLGSDMGLGLLFVACNYAYFTVITST